MPQPTCHSSAGLHHVVLPWRGGVGLFQAHPPSLDLLVQVPVEGGWRARLCDAGCHLLILDRVGQRLRVLEVGDEGDTEPVELPGVPATSRFEDAVMVGGVLFAGGALRRAPALWSTGAVGTGASWRMVPLQIPYVAEGKAIDFLFHHRDELVAVDDIVMPQWCLTWDIVDPSCPRHLLTEELPAHNSYEQVLHAACGDRYLALHSAGINHGHGSFHLSILSAESLRECACYNAFPDSCASGRRVGPAEQPLLPLVRGLAFAGDVLFAALGLGGLLRLDLRGPALAEDHSGSSGFLDSCAGAGPPPEVRGVPGLAQVGHVVASGAEGVYAAGLSAEGEARAVWVPAE